VSSKTPSHALPAASVGLDAVIARKNVVATEFSELRRETEDLAIGLEVRSRALAVQFLSFRNRASLSNAPQLTDQLTVHVQRTRDRSQKLTAGDLLLQKTLDQRGHWLWVDVNSSALEAVQRMTRANVGALLVMRERVLDVDADGVVTREEASRCVFFVLVFVFLFFCFFPPPPPPRTRTLTAAAAVPPKSLPFSSSSRHAQRQMGRRRRGRRHRARLPP
jgi:hypothetical protein